MIEIVVDEDVALEVRAHVHDGDIVVDGDERPNDGDPVELRIGPDRPPDVTIDATISYGELRIHRGEVVRRRLRVPASPESPLPPEIVIMDEE